MLKLMKYEFRKQLNSKLAIMAILGLLEIYFLYGVLANKQTAEVRATMLLSLLAVIAILYVSFECILTFNNDLRTKQSYMLFLTPQSTYSIVGAKILMAGIQIILVGCLFGLTAVLDIYAILSKNGQVSSLLDYITEMINTVFSIEVSVSNLLMTLFQIVVEWTLVVIIGMLAITLSATFMANTKLRSVVSFALFLALDIGVGKISKALFGSIVQDRGELICVLLFYAAIAVAAFFATSLMLQKKVSV